MDLIERHSHDFIVTDHVAAEITGHFPDQQVQFVLARQKGALRQKSIMDPIELKLFVELSKSGKLGLGECSSIAFAVHRGYMLAIDDRRASNQGKQINQTLYVLTTQDLVVSMIRENLLDVSEADTIKEIWAEHHSFTLPIQSFLEMLS